MLLQTNSYIVPKEKRAEHSRIIRRFRQTLLRLGCDHFEVYEQVGANWSNADAGGRYVQILRFNDKKHQLAVQTAERTDTAAQAVIAEFCELINFPYQQQQGLFAVGFYTSALPPLPRRDVLPESEPAEDQQLPAESEEELAPPAVVEESVEPEADASAQEEEFEAEEVIPPTQARATPPRPTEPHQSAHTIPASADDEFEDLMVDDLEESDPTFLDDDIEIEKPVNGVKPVADDLNSSHPAHAHKAKNRPMGW